VRAGRTVVPLSPKFAVNPPEAAGQAAVSATL